MSEIDSANSENDADGDSDGEESDGSLESTRADSENGNHDSDHDTNDGTKMEVLKNEEGDADRRPGTADVMLAIRPKKIQRG